MKHFLERLIKLLVAIALITLAIVLIALENDEKKEIDASSENDVLSDQYQITRLDSDERIDKGCKSIDIDEINVLYDGGDYILTGESTETFVVDVEEQIVHIILNGISIRTEGECALLIKSAGKVIITLADGSENVMVSDGKILSEYNANGTIHAECDLTINGSGSLYVYGYAKDAIYTKDTIKILNGCYDLFGTRDGIRGNDGIVIRGGTIKVQANRCGIHATKSENGNIFVTGGDVVSISKEYGVYAANNLLIKDCEFFSYGTTAMVYADGEEKIAPECWKNYKKD